MGRLNLRRTERSDLVHKVLDLTRRFPKWSSRQIGEQLGLHPAYVRAVWHRNQIFKGKHNPSVVYDYTKYVRLTKEKYAELLTAAGQT